MHGLYDHPLTLLGILQQYGVSISEDSQPILREVGFGVLHFRGLVSVVACRIPNEPGIAHLKAELMGALISGMPCSKGIARHKDM
jgi:hypothetical protein